MQRAHAHKWEPDVKPTLEIRDTLGKTIRYERQRRGVTIQELQEATKIKEEALEALEEDRYEDLPAPIFVKGFLKAVCQYLILPTNTIIEIYNRQAPPPPLKVMNNPTLVPPTNWWQRLIFWFKRLLGLL